METSMLDKGKMYTGPIHHYHAAPRKLPRREPVELKKVPHQRSHLDFAAVVLEGKATCSLSPISPLPNISQKVFILEAILLSPPRCHMLPKLLLQEMTKPSSGPKGNGEMQWHLGASLEFRSSDAKCY